MQVLRERGAGRRRVRTSRQRSGLLGTPRPRVPFAFAACVLALGLGTTGCPPAVQGPSPPGTSTPGFLGPDDFVGDFRPRGCDTKFGGEATYHGRDRDKRSG